MQGWFLLPIATIFKLTPHSAFIKKKKKFPWDSLPSFIKLQPLILALFNNVYSPQHLSPTISWYTFFFLFGCNHSMQKYSSQELSLHFSNSLSQSSDQAGSLSCHTSRERLHIFYDIRLGHWEIDRNTEISMKNLVWNAPSISPCGIEGKNVRLERENEMQWNLQVNLPTPCREFIARMSLQSYSKLGEESKAFKHLYWSGIRCNPGKREGIWVQLALFWEVAPKGCWQWWAVCQQHSLQLE